MKIQLVQGNRHEKIKLKKKNQISVHTPYNTPILPWNATLQFPDHAHPEKS